MKNLARECPRAPQEAPGLQRSISRNPRNQMTRSPTEDEGTITVAPGDLRSVVEERAADAAPTHRAIDDEQGDEGRSSGVPRARREADQERPEYTVPPSRDPRHCQLAVSWLPAESEQRG